MTEEFVVFFLKDGVDGYVLFQFRFRQEGFLVDYKLKNEAVTRAALMKCIKGLDMSSTRKAKVAKMANSQTVAGSKVRKGMIYMCTVLGSLSRGEIPV